MYHAHMPAKIWLVVDDILFVSTSHQGWWDTPNAEESGAMEGVKPAVD